MPATSSATSARTTRTSGATPRPTHRRRRRGKLVKRQHTIAVLVELQQSRRSVHDLRGIDRSISIRVQSSADRHHRAPARPTGSAWTHHARRRRSRTIGAGTRARTHGTPASGTLWRRTIELAARAGATHRPTRRHRHRTHLISGQHSVAALVQREQSRRSIRDLSRINLGIFVRIQSGNDGRDRRRTGRHSWRWTRRRTAGSLTCQPAECGQGH